MRKRSRRRICLSEAPSRRINRQGREKVSWHETEISAQERCPPSLDPNLGSLICRFHAISPEPFGCVTVGVNATLLNREHRANFMSFFVLG